MLAPTTVTDGPWREPVRGGHPDADLLARPGIEQLQMMVDGLAPDPPISRLTGMALESVRGGQAIFTLPLSGWLAGLDGWVTPGILSIPADAAMACSIMSGLPAWTPFTTSEMTLRFLRPVPAHGRVRATGRVISRGSPATLAEASLTDEQGSLLVHASSLCVTQAPTSPPATPSADAAPPAPEEGLDPWQRPAPAPPEPGAWSGLERLRASIEGELVPPVHRLTGVGIVSAEPGQVEAALPASPWFCAPPPGRLQGGVVTLLAETALFGAIRSVAAAGTTIHPAEIKLNFLRPLASDGRLATARGELVQSGRRIAVARVEVADADGRAVAVATGSALLAGPAA
jgi:uncharacterized protein (TIGR00369 family)